MDEADTVNEEEVDPRLEECWAFLLEVAHSSRPLANGFREKARLLLESHGITPHQHRGEQSEPGSPG